MTGIDKGLQLVRRACDDKDAVPAAQQMLRNWHHRLDRLTVLDGSGRHEVQSQMKALRDLLGDLHGDSALFTRRHDEAIRRIEPIRGRLVALVGEHGLD